jgi:GTPase SAR1 family protein
MGNICRRKSLKVLQEHFKEEKVQVKLMYSKVEKRRVVLVGPNGAGKTSLMMSLIDRGLNPESEKLYDTTKRVQLGLKVLNPRSVMEHPVSIRIIDTPGS